jgi:hypothetical protein
MDEEYKQYQYIRMRQRLAGQEYEHDVAEKLRQEGWDVNETGREGVNDHGIDLIASKDGVRRYIQCKGLKQTRLIHEDVVSHLYGSVAIIEGRDNLDGVELYIYSPAQLDDYAKYAAERLHINFELFDYPHTAWHHKYTRYFRGRRRNGYRRSQEY